jgi:hypothetical protein
LYLQVPLCQLLLCLLAVGRFLLFAGMVSLKTLQLLLGFTIEAWIGYGVAVRVGGVGFQTDINADVFACGCVLDLASGIKRELTIVAVCTTDQTDTFDFLYWEVANALTWIADQAQATNATPISEDNMLAIRLKLPPCLLVFYGTVIVLKARKALLARLLLFAVLVEARDREPCTIRCNLACLGIESVGEGKRFGENRAIALQIIPAGATSIHPQAQALVTDELGGTNSLINGRIVCLGASYLVLVDQQSCCLSFRLIVRENVFTLLPSRTDNIPMDNIVSDKERKILFCSVGFFLSIATIPNPSRHQKEESFIPRFKDGAFWLIFVMFIGLLYIRVYQELPGVEQR